MITSRRSRVSQPIVPKIRYKNLRLNVPLVSWTDAKSRKSIEASGTGDFGLMLRRAMIDFDTKFPAAK